MQWEVENFAKKLRRILSSCSCHLAHLAAGAAGQAYQGVTDFDMEGHQAYMYYFKNSMRRKGILLEYLEFMGQEWERMSRFVQTRWLSLEDCCNKEFKKFPSLKSMFQSRIEIGETATKEGKNKD